VNRSIRAALGCFAIASLASGCEPGAPEANKSDQRVAGPNRRIMSNDKYKELIGKDGKPVWTPGKPMTPPSEKPKP
jgi:hypothetical protein